MASFVKTYLLGVFALWAAILSPFLLPRAKRLAAYLGHVPYLGAFLRLVAPPAPAQALPPPLPDPFHVSIRQEDEGRLATVIGRGVNDGNKALVDKKEEECALLLKQNSILLEQNRLLRRLLESEEQRPAYTYELVRRPVPRPPAAPVAPDHSPD